MVVPPASPPVFIERDEAPQQQSAPQQAAPQQAQWWYYCQSARAYYPYVRECPEAWQRVSPTPPPPS